ncbi:SAM-dependent methyltransferase [Pengzhenrongella sp.]|jgi:tocopherol O-methyltransferase|uniref:SAM-dependent methyltransferase n=1 Tax=Pengzhenrongella sp. TaxID=2888820 RepID=UPI002F94073C
MPDAQHTAVLRYYAGTRWDYKHLWRSEQTLAIHFGYYDDSATTHRQALARMNAVLASCARIDAADVVLDAGCGMGGSALWLAEHVGCPVLGINITAHQLQSARSAARQRRLDHLARFEARDYTSTGLPAADFSVVWALESVVHAASKAEFAAEAFRLLRPGGRLVLAEYLVRDHPVLTAAETEILRQWLDGWAMPSLLSEPDYRSVLGAAGFGPVRVWDITDRVRPSLARLDRITSALLPFAAALRSCRVIGRGHLENARACLAQLDALDRGLWRYKLLVAEKT